MLARYYPPKVYLSITCLSANLLACVSIHHPLSCRYFAVTLQGGKSTQTPIVFSPWRDRRISPSRAWYLNIDGYSEIGAHLGINLFKATESSHKLNLSSSKIHIFPYACATYPVLPSNIRTIILWLQTSCLAQISNQQRRRRRKALKSLRIGQINCYLYCMNQTDEQTMKLLKVRKKLVTKMEHLCGVEILLCNSVAAI